MRCAGNMHFSYYKWNMAIICNPPIMLCATFVPCSTCVCLQLLQPWSCTIPNHERERSVHLMYVLLGVHLEHVDPVQVTRLFYVHWVHQEYVKPVRTMTILALTHSL